MKRLCTILATALAATLQAGVPLRLATDVRAPAAHQASAYRGETLEIQARLTDGGRPLAVQPGAAASMLWQTNGMGQAWWSAPATVGTNGVVSATWSPTNDCGAAAYRIFLGVSDGGRNWRANLLLRMLDSPGAAPNELEPPVTHIDFARTEVANAPWLTDEADPIFAAWAETNEYARTINGYILKDGNINISATNGIAMDGRVLGNINNPGYKRLVGITFGLDPEALDKYATWDGLAEWYGDATNYTDAAVAAIDVPDPDYSRENAELVATIEAVAPAPGDYAAVSNAAMSALQSFDESDPVWLAEKAGYATKNEVQSVEASVNLVAMMVQGSNVVAEVTNYNSRAHAPALRILQLGESNEYFQVWAETNGLARTLAAANAHSDTNRAELAADAAASFAPRAWSGTTSGLGAPAPEGWTWISTPNLAIGGGLEFEKHITSGGAIWILRNNGMVAQFDATTNNAAYLEIASIDGEPVLRIERTDAQMLGVNTASVSVEGDTLVCGVAVVSSEHPLARVRASLTQGEWAREEDDIPASLATVQWSGEPGAWVCRITNNTGGNSLFATMAYLQEGSTKIVPAAPLDASAGILCTDGVHRVRPVYSGGAVTWEVFQ